MTVAMASSELSTRRVTVLAPVFAALFHEIAPSRTASALDASVILLYVVGGGPLHPPIPLDGALA